MAYYSLAGTVLFSAVVLGLVPLTDREKKKNYIELL